MFGDEIGGVVQHRQHAEAEKVELHQAGSRAVVLVPLQDAAVFHASPLDRAHLDHRPVAHDHAAGVNTEMPGEVFDLGRQLDHGKRDGGVVLDRSRQHIAPPVNLRGEGILLTLGVPERLGHVANRRFRPVGDDVGDLGGVVTAVAVVDVLDDFLTTVGLDVDVDVGGSITLGREEPLEQQPERHGVGVGDTEGETDCRVRCRAPALTEDVGPPTEVDDVPHDKEIPGETEFVDEVEFTVELCPGTLDPFSTTGPIATGTALLDQPTEVPHLIEAVGTRVRRQVRSDQGEVERTVHPKLVCPLHHTRVAPEPECLFLPRTQVHAGRRQPTVDLVEAATGPNRRHRRRKPLPGDRVVVDVTGGDDVDPDLCRQLGHGVVAHRVHRQAVVPQFDEHVGPPEITHQAHKFMPGSHRPISHERSRHRALAAGGEHRPVIAGALPAEFDKAFVRDPGRPLLPCQLAFADRATEQGVATGIAGKDDEVTPSRVGRTGTLERTTRLGQGEFGSEDRGQIDRSGRLGEPHHAVEAVVVGEGEGFQTEPGGLFGQLLGV